MSPFTSCTAANAATTCNQPGAVCYTGATGLGLIANTCTVPMDPTTWRPAPGCTGFESAIQAAEPLPDGTSVVPTAGDDLFDSAGIGSAYGAGVR